MKEEAKNKIIEVVRWLIIIVCIILIVYIGALKIKNHLHLKELESLSDNPADYGYIADLSIPDLDVEVPVYDTRIATVDVNLQDIVDMKDSAVIFAQRDTDFYIIADHAHQGFRAIKNAIPNETRAYFNGEEYICAYNFTGKNLDELVDENGENINSYNGKADICMYTCMDSRAVNIYIVMWKKV